MKNNVNISIEKRKKGKTIVYVAILHDYKDSLVFAPDLKELFEAIESTIELAKEEDIVTAEPNP